MAKRTTQPAPALVNDLIAEATAPAPAADQEPQEEKAGSKKDKMDRVNLALEPENAEYIKIMARVTGGNTTEFVNRILEQHRQANAELYEKARAFRAALENFKF